jgi:hypothetical protein
VYREPISPELVLIDPELARSPHEQETVMTDLQNSTQTDAGPSIETLMFKAGLISADDLGELVRDAVVAQRPVAALAIERNLVSPRALETLLAQSRSEEEAPVPVGAAPSEPEPLLEPVQLLDPVPIQPAASFAPAPVAEPLPAAVHAGPDEAAVEIETHIAVAPDPAPVAAPEHVEPTPLHVVEPLAEAGQAFEVLVRLANGQTSCAGRAISRDAAEELARTTAQRFHDGREWPLVGGRCIRPDVVISVDVVRKLED